MSCSESNGAGAEPPAAVRWVGVDYGTRRVGLALSDSRAAIASPMTTLTLDRVSHSAAAKAVVEWARGYGATHFVVGLPLNMNGSDSAQTRHTRQFAAALTAIATRVELWDERLSSYQADEMLRQQGVRIPKRDARRDALAALVILQSFLDGRRSGA